MLDFFLWGELQHRVNQIGNRSIDVVQEKVRDEIAAITPDILERVHQNLFKRSRVCIQQDGGLFEHLL